MEKAVFLAPKPKLCIVIDENRMLSQKTIFKLTDQKMMGLNFRVFPDLEGVSTISSKSKLTFKRDLDGITVPHKELNCLDCDNTKKCAQCEKKPEMKCSICEMARSFRKCIRKNPKLFIIPPIAKNSNDFLKRFWLYASLSRKRFHLNDLKKLKSFSYNLINQQHFISNFALLKILTLMR